MLTQRVLRLLLGGAPPSRILCLTFTKAAAANMAERVFRTLAKWTRLPDAELSLAIVKAGAAAGRRGAAQFRAAAVRAHHRDARRSEDPDDPRVLRTAAASFPV